MDQFDSVYCEVCFVNLGYGHVEHSLAFHGGYYLRQRVTVSGHWLALSTGSICSQCTLKYLLSNLLVHHCLKYAHVEHNLAFSGRDCLR